MNAIPYGEHDDDHDAAAAHTVEEQRPGSGEHIDIGSAANIMLRPALDGAALLDDVKAFIRRFCAFPDAYCLTAVTLWAAHTHMVQHFHTTPRLALLSPEPGSGKTRVQDVLHLIVANSLHSLSASPAAVFRKLAQEQITLLLDECDTVFTGKGKDDTNEDLRALLNAGYKRGARIPRCVGPRHEVVEFPVYAAVALAGLGDLPATIMTRSIVIPMRRRAPTEKVEAFRTRQHEAPGHALRERLARWADEVGKRVGDMWPVLPEGIVDRPAEVWEPIIAVADAAGGEWPEGARSACIAMCTTMREEPVSLGVRLLSDLRAIFDGAIALHTETILDRLCNGERFGLASDAPWSDLRGSPMDMRKLARMLKPYGIASQKVTVGGKSLQGYRREHLWDAWQRYLPPATARAESTEFPESAKSGLADTGVDDSTDSASSTFAETGDGDAAGGVAW